MEACTLCRPDLAPILAQSEFWTLMLNTNQRFLGACFLSLRRHLEPVTELTPAEWTALQPELIRATQALKTSFQPDHFNYAFLQNQDRHIHMHIYPRYARSRTFAGVVFDDPDYPSHYSVPGPSRRLTPEQYNTVTRTLQNALETQAADG
jgi:diadenosine tetraphosphate (Ap4A) HIT family hydrolase